MIREDGLRRFMMKRLIFILCVVVGTGVNAKVYKWVDEKGVTHYGAKKPGTQDVEEVKVQKASPPPKQLTGGAKEMADGLAKEILRDKGDADEVDCKKAVFNAKDGIDTMLSVGKKNYEDGYVEKEEYAKVSSGLKKVRGKISMYECERSKGDVRGFYKCMSNDYNHVMTCGKKYNYGE